MIKGVEEFFNANANSSLKEVTFVVFADPEIKRALISALKTAAALSTKPTNVEGDLLNEGFGSPLTDAERIAAREEKLKKTGFSAEDIAEIKGRFPNLNVVPMTPIAGDDISGIVEDAVALKRSLDQGETEFAVVFKLNGDLVFVDEDDTLKRVCDAYLKAN